MTYEYLEDLSRADVAFLAKGETLEEMFASAGKAVTNTMVSDLKTVEQKEEKKIELEADDVENLLHKFLEEFVFFKDTEQLLFSEIEVNIDGGGDEKDSKYSLKATLHGEKLDMKKHELTVEVKAITWHKFSVEKNDTWKCVVVVDV